MNALGQHADTFVHEGAKYPRGKEAAAVVHHNGNLAYLLHVIERPGQGVIGGFLADDDFHQLHLVHRGEKKCRPIKLSGLAEAWANWVMGGMVEVLEAKMPLATIFGSDSWVTFAFRSLSSKTAR